MRCVLGAGMDKLRDEAYAKTVIAEMGGVQKLAEGMREVHGNPPPLDFNPNDYHY